MHVMAHELFKGSEIYGINEGKNIGWVENQS
jgi:hypothetical protein